MTALKAIPITIVWKSIQEAPKPHNGILLLWSIEAGPTCGYWNENTKSWFDWTEDYMDYQPTMFAIIKAPYFEKLDKVNPSRDTVG